MDDMNNAGNIGDAGVTGDAGNTVNTGDAGVTGDAGNTGNLESTGNTSDIGNAAGISNMDDGNKDTGSSGTDPVRNGGENYGKGRGYGNEHLYGHDATAAYAYHRPKVPLWFIKTKNIIYYILGLIEVLLAFRFVFKLLGANPASGFVTFLYSLTGIFIAPFSGIFYSYRTTGAVTTAVVEPATIIAMLIYAVLAWGIVRMLIVKITKDGHENHS